MELVGETTKLGGRRVSSASSLSTLALSSSCSVLLTYLSLKDKVSFRTMNGSKWLGERGNYTHWLDHMPLTLLLVAAASTRSARVRSGHKGRVNNGAKVLQRHAGPPIASDLTPFALCEPVKQNDKIDGAGRDAGRSNSVFQKGVRCAAVRER